METVQAHALGTHVSISGHGAARALAELERLEGILTRFADSPLTRLNRDGGLENPPMELIEALEHALWVAAWTDGLVTPAVLNALEAAGYAQSWPTRSRVAGSGTQTLEPPTVADWREIEVRPERIRLPRGARVDLGGTAKTWIAERVSRLLEGDFAVDAGGDIVARQSAPFTLALEQPFHDETLALELPAGRWGVATSSTLKRAWDGGHHLIDPRSGRPLESELVQVTAVAPQATTAEVLTKLALFQTGRTTSNPVPDGPRNTVPDGLERMAGLAQPMLGFDRNGTCLVWDGRDWVAREVN